MEFTNEELMVIENSLEIIIEICEAKDADPDKIERIKAIKAKISNCIKGGE